MRDKTGHVPDSYVSGWEWLIWLLGLLDGPSPALDALALGGLLLFGGLLMASEKTIDNNSAPPNNLVGEDDVRVPNVKYPGDDPEKAPDGYEWRGPGKQGSHEGNIIILKQRKVYIQT